MGQATGQAEGQAIRVVVNGDDHTVGTGATVADVVAALCASSAGIAVARNREVVPKGAWRTTRLEPGDHIEIVTAAAGG